MCRDALHARSWHFLPGQDDRGEGATSRRLQRDVQPGEVLYRPQSCWREQLQTSAVDVHDEASAVRRRRRTPAHHRYRSLRGAPKLPVLRYQGVLDGKQRMCTYILRSETIKIAALVTSRDTFKYKYLEMDDVWQDINGITHLCHGHSVF